MRVILRSIFNFYRSFIFLSFIINVICLFVIGKTDFNLFMLMFWFKVVAMLITFYFISDYKRKEFFYYQNLGVSRKLLWVSTFTFDIFLFLMASFLIYII